MADEATAAQAEKKPAEKKPAGRKKAVAAVFPDMRNLNASTADPPEETAPGPGLKRCRCVRKHFLRGVVVPAGKIGYFREIPDHFEEAGED